MILSFKKQFPWGAPTNFEEKIISGDKIHTIRHDPHNRWISGRKIHMATGVRTKNYRCFDDSKSCISKQRIEIIYVGYSPMIKVYHTETIWTCGNSTPLFDRFSKNDGFDSTKDFFRWFDKDFSGVIIHWTDFRY